MTEYLNFFGSQWVVRNRVFSRIVVIVFNIAKNPVSWMVARPGSETGFLREYWLEPLIFGKNPVSWVGVRPGR